MNINISSKDFLSNLNAYNTILKEELQKGVVPQKDINEPITLEKDELVFFHVLNVKEVILLVNRVDKKYLFHKNSIEKNPKNKPKVKDVELIITNKKLYIKSEKTKEIKLKNIYQIDIKNKSLIIYDEIKGSNSHKKTEVIINDWKIKMRIILLLEILQNVPITDDLAGKKVNFDMIIK